MSNKSKFKGKIRDNPLVALERGRREVMLSLWQEYLDELLELAPASGRRRLLVARIEKEADFPTLYQEWDDCPPQPTGGQVAAVVRTAKSIVAATRDECLRCGDCCEHSSPTLLMEDLALLQNEILHWTDIVTLRAGERAYDPRSRQLVTLTEERLKLREQPGSHRCLFFATQPNRCLIYEHRPRQCHQQFCNRDPEEPASPSGTPLTRRAIFEAHPEIWQLLTAHEERCSLTRLAAALSQTDPTIISDTLFELLHFDYYLRQHLSQEWQLPTRALDFLLGRPLPEILPQFGLQAKMTPTGTFTLERAAST